MQWSTYLHLILAFWIWFKIFKQSTDICSDMLKGYTWNLNNDIWTWKHSNLHTITPLCLTIQSGLHAFFSMWNSGHMAVRFAYRAVQVIQVSVYIVDKTALRVRGQCVSLGPTKLMAQSNWSNSSRPNRSTSDFPDTFTTSIRPPTTSTTVSWRHYPHSCPGNTYLCNRRRQV